MQPIPCRTETSFTMLLSDMLLRPLPRSLAIAALTAALGQPPLAFAQCGCAPAVPAAMPATTQTYRLEYRTVYDEQQVTAYRIETETVYDEKTVTVQKPVWETETRERRYTVQKPVWETQTREERYTVQKPVWETVVEDRSYDVVRDVVETSTREERITVMKPVYETSMQQQTQVVRRPVYETSTRDEAYTVTEPVTTVQTAYSYGTQAVDTVTPVVTPGSTSLAWAQGNWVVNPYTGLATWQRGGLTWVQQPGMVTNQVSRVVQPTGCLDLVLLVDRTGLHCREVIDCLEVLDRRTPQLRAAAPPHMAQIMRQTWILLVLSEQVPRVVCGAGEV